MEMDKYNKMEDTFDKEEQLMDQTYQASITGGSEVTIRTGRTNQTTRLGHQITGNHIILLNRN